MRLRDENKRKLIVETAIRLFAEQPFNRVRLDDVADAAGVGKGTVYIYFKNKEDLYYSVVYEGFSEMVARLGSEMASQTTTYANKVLIIVQGIVDFGIRHPQFFEAMRIVAVPDASSMWDGKRKECSQLIEQTIRQGIAAGEFVDPRPDRTGLYLMGMVRSVMLYGPKIDQDHSSEVAQHIWTVLLKGIAKKKFLKRSE